MTSKRSKNREDRNAPEEGVNDGSVGDDASSSSSDSDSSADSSTESPPPPESINGDQIRKNARELLQSSPGASGGKAGSASPAAVGNIGSVNASGYQSYHDAPTVRMSSTVSSSSQFATPSMTSSSPPWAGRDDAGGLSMTDVASMAFSCVAHCLTEGYRAASSYYGGYEQSSQYPSVSNAGASPGYQQVSGYQNDAYDSKSYYNDKAGSGSGSGSGGYKNNNGYSGGYQTKFSDDPNQHKEVMDRGTPAQSAQTSGQDTVSEEWGATVHVPSTYQGGRVGSGNIQVV